MPTPAILILLFFARLPGAQDTEPATQVFADGQAQVVEAFEDPAGWIQHDLWVETEFDSDGDGELDRVHVDVTRPGQTETEGLRVPVIYESSPYFSGTGTTDPRYFWSPEQELGAEPPVRAHQPPVEQKVERPLMSRSLISTWVPRGFAVVHSSAPGTGLSEGCPTVGGPTESLAPKAVIDWLNGRARGFEGPDGDAEVRAGWCTGRVGMTGTSYNGTLALAAAATGVEGLEAIVPVAANTSYYRYYRSNGLVRHPGGYLGEDVDVLYEFIHSGSPERRAYCNETVRDTEMAQGLDRETGDFNPFWAGRDLSSHLGEVRAATLMAHGLNDWNVMPAHSVLVYDTLRSRGVPAAIYLHQGGHGGPPPHELMNRWFTRYLCGVENDVEGDPRAWVVREGVSRRKPTPYPDYPHPEAVPVTLYPEVGGTAVGALSLLPPPAATVERLIDDVSHAGAELAMAEQSDHRLLYATPELGSELHLSGTARITLRLSSSAPGANLSVWLVSLPWTEDGKGNDNVITRGWADPQNRGSLSESRPLAPGEWIELAFDLQPDDQIIPAGARLGLMIFSSDRDFTLWPPPGTELTLDLASTSLELPVVGGPGALALARK